MNRKNITLLATLLTVFSYTATVGAAESYWVLGSFEVTKNAMKEVEKLRAKGEMDIKVAKYELAGATYNRLIVEKDGSSAQRDAIEALGITPWTLNEGGATVAQYTRPAIKETPYREQPAPRAEMQIVYQSVDVTPPGSGESYVEYCVQKANPKERELFCSDGMFKRMMGSVN